MAIALGVLTLALGRFSPAERFVTGAVIALFFLYLIFRERRGFRKEYAWKNLLGLFPGHLLLLFAIATTKSYNSYLLLVWIAMVGATLGFDILANRKEFKMQRGILGMLYCAVWVDLFFLIRQLVVSGGRLSERTGFMVSIGITIFAIIYLLTAIYRFAKLEPTGWKEAR